MAAQHDRAAGSGQQADTVSGCFYACTLRCRGACGLTQPAIQVRKHEGGRAAVCCLSQRECFGLASCIRAWQQQLDTSSLSRTH